MRKTFLLLIITLGSVIAQDLSEKAQSKIHPKFIELIKQSQKPERETVTLFPEMNLQASTSTEETLYPAIIYTNQANVLLANGVHVNSELENFVTSRLTLNDMLKIAELTQITYIDAGEILYPHNDVAVGLIGADLAHQQYINNTAYTGSGVLVCIVDTGIDWDILDFRDPDDTTKSRILKMWDQSNTPDDPGENHPTGFNYGIEYTQAHINDEIDGSPAGFVEEKDINGHGTHVAGSAAGNGASITTYKYSGIAPEADLLVVKAGDGSFPTTNIIDALTWAATQSTNFGKPVVVNLSLGGHSNAHDGQSTQSQAVDAFCGTGKIAVISAGNEGDDNIHYSVTIPAGSTGEVSFTVPSYTPASGSLNDYFLFNGWFDSGIDVTAVAETPTDTAALTRTAGAASGISTSEGFIYISNIIDSDNSDRKILFQVYDSNPALPPATGTWKLKLTNNGESSTTFHGWLYLTTIGATLPSGNSNYNIGSPGDAANALTVGSYVSRWQWTDTSGTARWYGSSIGADNISSFSSIGPRRDGVQKPEIAAPGQAIISCFSSDASTDNSNIIVGGKYFKNQGTSMSAPVATGAVALLLQENNSATYSDIKSLITGNADTDSYTGDGLPDYTWGYGKLNIFKALSKAVNSSWTPTHDLFAYDAWGATSSKSVSLNEKIAVRFSPSTSGIVSGLFFHPSTLVGFTGNLSLEIWSDNSGLPGSKLGSTIFFGADKTQAYSWNFVEMADAAVNVTAGTDYHAVLYFTAGSTTYFRMDTGSIDNRSSLYTSGSWGSYGSGDFRIRPIVATSPSALPVELMTFKASGTKKGILLEWSTATEQNNVGFEIERASSSTDKYKGTSQSETHFEIIGFVEGNLNSNRINYYSYTDSNPIGGNKFIYRLKQIDTDGTFTYSPEVTVLNTPLSYSMEQNYPNPFNPKTNIQFGMPVQGKVSVAIYNTLGEKVGALLKEKEFEAGTHKIDFDGSGLPSGVYFYEIRIGNRFTDVKKMMLLK